MSMKVPYLLGRSHYLLILGLVGCATAEAPHDQSPAEHVAGAANVTGGGGSGAAGVPSTAGGSSGAVGVSNGGANAAGSSGTGGAAGASRGGPSSGCGKAPRDRPGGVQVSIDAGAAGDGMRSYYLSIPSGYDPNKPHRLIIGYPGTDWTGKMIQPYLDLETDRREDEIFAYPDPLVRDLVGWGRLGGWLLGPNAEPAKGNQDVAFTSALLDDLEENYCIDRSRVFVTGHSWGGDMAQVVSCFIGDRFAASIPIAANRPYWFEKADGTSETCVGKTATWTMFGSGDEHFGAQESYPGQFGDECRDFWLTAAHCSGADANQMLPYGSGHECFDYSGCDRPTRYCLYGPETGHQRPAYFPVAAMTYFRSF
jgi:polyhydroxybutyrate depolymerase